MTRKQDAEDRKQRRLHRLGTQAPSCACCSETNPAVFEDHHIAGRKHHDDTALICANCHRKLSDQQRDHVPQRRIKPAGPKSVIGHYLLGLADLLAMVVETLRQFGNWLIEQAMPARAT